MDYFTIDHMQDTELVKHQYEAVIDRLLYYIPIRENRDLLVALLMIFRCNAEKQMIEGALTNPDFHMMSKKERKNAAFCIFTDALIHEAAKSYLEPQQFVESIPCTNMMEKEIKEMIVKKSSSGLSFKPFVRAFFYIEYKKQEQMLKARGVKHNIIDMEKSYKEKMDNLNRIEERLEEIKRETSPEHDSYESSLLVRFMKEWKIERIYQYLQEHIVGQERACRIAAMVLYQHVARIIHLEQGKVFPKNNCLMYGPTGCGKTEIWRVISRISPVGIHIIDSSTITTSGFQGLDVGDLFTQIMNQDEEAEQAIIVLDEFDKLCRPAYTSRGENVSLSVQGELLKILEGEELYYKGNPRPIDTSNMTFVCAGAYEELDQPLEKPHVIGFDVPHKSEPSSFEMDETIRERFVQFGMIPELVGRIDYSVALNELTEKDYYNLLCGRKNSWLDKISQKYTAFYGVSVEITDSAKKELAHQSKHGVFGVRGIGQTVERLCAEKLFGALSADENQIVIDTKDLTKSAEKEGSYQM